jgi:hypothetical protein
MSIDLDAVHKVLMDVWHRELSADEGLDELQHLITPPQRQWVGLTDEEKQAIKFANSSMGLFFINYDLNKMLSDSEAKLKEKNL